MLNLYWLCLKPEPDVCLSMKNRCLYIIIILSSLISAAGFSQIRQLSVSASNDSILIGQQTELTIRAVKDKKVHVGFPLLTDTLLTKIEIISKTHIDTVLSGKDVVLSQKLYITAFDSGTFTIPPMPFSIEFNEIRDTIYSLPVLLRVDLPEIDPAAGFRDIKPPVNTPVNLREALPYILVALVLILITVSVIIIVKKLRSKNINAGPDIPKVPPYIIALDELQHLRAEKAWEKLSIKDYYTRLSGIVRIYLENQFVINALESTTIEILNNFERAFGKNKDIKTKLEELLQLSDLVKFAKEMPTPDMNLKNLDKAILFVELTKPAISDNTDHE